MNPFSVCIIAKNEERTLERCLKSLQPLDVEIILVDTGSTDQTKKIAEKYTSCIYDFQWIDDFSAARNYSISKASNDWILIMDCDEWITEFDLSGICSFMEKHPQVIGQVDHHNMMDENDATKTYIVALERFFNRNHYQYNGTVHEQIVSKGTAYDTQEIPITVWHDGYCKTLIDSEEKFKRNVSLLEKQLKKKPDDPYTLFQLGQSYFQRRDYDAALSWYEKAMAQSLNYKSQAAQLVVYNWINCLNVLQRSEEALAILPHYDELCEYADFPVQMGHVYANMGQYLQAMSEYLKATSIPKCHTAGSNSYIPFYYIGKINAILGNPDMARAMYEKCGSYEPALEALREMG